MMPACKPLYLGCEKHYIKDWNYNFFNIKKKGEGNIIWLIFTLIVIPPNFIAYFLRYLGKTWKRPFWIPCSPPSAGQFSMLFRTFPSTILPNFITTHFFFFYFCNFDRTRNKINNVCTVSAVHFLYSVANNNHPLFFFQE